MTSSISPQRLTLQASEQGTRKKVSVMLKLKKERKKKTYINKSSLSIHHSLLRKDFPSFFVDFAEFYYLLNDLMAF